MPQSFELVFKRLETAFVQAGLEPAQCLRVLDWQSGPRFWGVLDLMDLYLDLPAFSGYTTAWQALHRGLPIVTLEGEFLRQRLAAGLLRQVPEAQMLYHEILQVAPEHSEVLYISAVCAHQQRDLALALAHSSKATAITPGEGRYHNQYGIALQALGRLAEAHHRCLMLPDSHVTWNRRCGRCGKQQGNSKGEAKTRPKGPNGMLTMCKSLCSLYA